MKKILITTLQGANYGNRLQNYALQEYLKKNGCEVYNPYYTPVEYSTIIGKIKHTIKKCLGRVGVLRFKNELAKEAKERLFHEFDKKWINNRFWINFKKTKELKKYDYAITGSDQVWHNWSNTKAELNYFYLDFIEKEKRISYAPSFGFSTITKDKDIHKKGLNEIENLSCRENKGVEIIMELTGRKAELVPDPTFLLETEEWIKFEEKPQYEINKDFVVVYFLGNIHEHAKDLIRQFNDKGIQIIDLMNTETKYFLSTPNNFVWLIHNAKYILTDSFHACVFSIMFNKKFVSYRRQDKYVTNMYDRIQTLLDFTNCNQFTEENIESLDKLDNLEIYDSAKAFEDYRKKGIAFLMKSLCEFDTVNGGKNK